MASRKAKRGFFAFFKTEFGRKVVYTGACVATVSLFVGNFVPQTIFLNKYRDIVQCYKHGVPKQLPEKVLKRFEMALDKLDVHPVERKLIKPFAVYGFDVFQAGSAYYHYGALIGIPSNYSYDSPKDIEKHEIRFRDTLINWTSESGKLLEESLILEEDEQIFGICRAILEGKTNNVLWNSLFPSITFSFIYSVGHNINIKMHLLERPLALRLLMYTILGLFGVGLWFFMKDFNQVMTDTEIDKKLSELGPEFVDAGLRFYDKLLKKNIAIRELSGNNTYTVKGNFNYLIRQKSLPLTLRKSFFEMKLKELQENLSNDKKLN